MLETLPDDLLQRITLHLPAPDICNLLSTCTNFHQMGKPYQFFKMLLERDDPDRLSQQNHHQEDLRRCYIQACQILYPIKVQWKNIQIDHYTTPRDREGHLMCQMGRHRIILTGGFCDDERVHVLDANDSKGWKALTPVNPPPFVYGASLTSLGDENAAIQFGGFRSGGYHSECNDLYLLRLDTNEHGDDVAKWERIVAKGGAHDDDPVGRAYHTATLIDNRYLVIIGGMTPRGSILSEAVLDVQSWTWLSGDMIRAGADPSARPRPSGRHGHSTVYDEKRGRLILFGGGNGRDLLRSGEDNSEVWELQLRLPCDDDDSEKEEDISFPWTWTWRLIHGNDDAALSPCEKLGLGRCHIGLRTSPSTVLLFSGGGRPSTNGILVYDLPSDQWKHPFVEGALPMPRFTAAAALLDDWMVVHGGYTIGVGTLGDVWVLDLAPDMKRQFHPLPHWTGHATATTTTREERRNIDWRILNFLTTLAPSRLSLVDTTWDEMMEDEDYHEDDDGE